MACHARLAAMLHCLCNTVGIVGMARLQAQWQSPLSPACSRTACRAALWGSCPVSTLLLSTCPPADRHTCTCGVIPCTSALYSNLELVSAGPYHVVLSAVLLSRLYSAQSSTRHLHSRPPSSRTAHDLLLSRSLPRQPRPRLCGVNNVGGAFCTDHV